MKALLVAGLLIALGTIANAAPDEQRIAQLLSTGQIAEARKVLEAGDPTDLDKRFFEARVAKGAGRLIEAIEMFRALLQAEPRYLNARRELAHTLLLAGSYDSAEFHFRELIKIDPDPELVTRYRQFLRIIGDNQPISISAYGAILPSTNINRGTTNAVFDTDIGQFVIDEESQAESGIGAELGVSGVARLALDQRSRFLLEWNVGTRFYENSEFNAINGYLGPAYEYAFSQGRWQAGPYVRYNWNGGDQSNFAVGGQAALVHRLSQTTSARISSRYEIRTFRDQDFRDGGFVSSAITLREQLDPSLSINGGVAVDRDAPETAHQRYRGYRLTTGVAKRWQGGFDTQVSVEYGQRLYDADFPLTSAPRRDGFWGASFSVLTSQVDLWGVTPQLQCSYQNTTSNISLFEFDASECRVGFSREF